MTTPTESPSETSRQPQRKSGRWFWSLMGAMGLAAIGIVGFTNPGWFGTGDHARTPEVMIQLLDNPPRILTPLEPRDTASFEAFRRGQARLIKSPLLVERALAFETTRGAALNGAPNPERLTEWIADQLDVEFASPELMIVKLAATPRADAVSMLNAICQEYIAEITTFEREQALQNLERLEQAQADLLMELRKKKNEVKAFTERIGGGSDNGLFVGERQVFAAMQADLHRVRISLIAKESELDLLLNRKDAGPDTSAEFPIAMEVERDPTRAALEARRMVLNMLLSETGEDSSESVKAERERWSRELHALNQVEGELSAIRQTQIAARSRESANHDRIARRENLQFEVALLKKEFEKFEQEADRMRANLAKTQKSSADVEMMQFEIEQLEKVAREVSEKYYRQRVELRPRKDHSIEFGTHARILHAAR